MRGQANKPFMLSVAARCGLRIPRTLITNELDALEGDDGAEEMIAKPVPGGGYARCVGELLRTTRAARWKVRRARRSCSSGWRRRRCASTAWAGGSSRSR